jgi:general secretion pathway protein L
MAEAEALLNQAPELRTAAQTLLDAADRGLARGWELRQFDLAGTRPGRAPGRLWRQAWTSPTLRPWRWGVATLLLVQVAAVVLAAWQQQARLADLQRQQVGLLQTTFPHVRSVLDAPLQMQREAEGWLSARGLSSGTDVESALAVAARAWPEGAAAATRAGYNRQGLQLQVAPWPSAQRQTFASAVAAQGWQARSQEQGGALVWTLKGSQP